ncbi:MAG TPA: hypothetical protein VK590_08720 [Saprospiraceae bacterium]|nr:hypothetical protein [Saprospiraceae bacterium]
MKTILSLILALGILTVFAVTNSKIDKGQNQFKKIPKVTKELKKLNTLTPCEQAVYDGIAACYGVENGDVCCINAGSPTYYHINSSGFTGQIYFTDCGKGCTQCCLYIGGVTECCFIIHYEAWPC